MAAKAELEQKRAVVEDKVVELQNAHVIAWTEFRGSVQAAIDDLREAYTKVKADFSTKLNTPFN